MKGKSFFYLYKVLQKTSIKFSKKIPNILIKNISDIESAKKNYLTFITSPKYLPLLKKSKASVILTSDKLVKFIPKRFVSIVSENVEIDFIKILNIFFPNSYYSKITYNSYNDNEIRSKFKTLKFGKNFYLEKNVLMGKNVYIGNNVTIKQNCIIGNNVIIGSNVLIENSHIFDDVHICDGSVIGKKGFGFKFFRNKLYKIPHIGKVVINKGCEIGSNCVIDRGSVKNTVIKENTFIDNLVHIAHNVNIGKNCIVAAQVGIAGSTIIGNNVTIGGQAGISGHLNIGNNVKIGGKSGVVKNIKDNQVVMGYPAKPFREFIKNNKKDE